MPLVGVTCPWSVETWSDSDACGGYIYVGKPYVDFLEFLGASAVLIPPIFSENNFRNCLTLLEERLDALLFSGGGDARRAPGAPLPSLEGQQPLRYRWERELLRYAKRRNLPCLGICRGFQMMVEGFGGSLRTSVVAGHSQKLPGTQGSHLVFPVEGSLFAQLVGSEPWCVNSFHVQAVEKIPEGFILSCSAEDGVCEGIESTEEDFFLGVQFHPEELFQGKDARAEALLRAFVGAAEAVALRRRREG